MSTATLMRSVKTKKIQLLGSIASAPKLQEKIVVPTEERQIITPDEGYDGLSKVTVERTGIAAPNAAIIPIDGPTGEITVTVETEEVS